MDQPDQLPRHIATAADARDAVNELLDEAVAVEQLMAGLTALRYELVDSARRVALFADGVLGTTDQVMTRRAFRAELACALAIPEPTADRLTSEAETLIGELPATLAALRKGDIRERHARILVDQLVGLSPEDRASVEAAALEIAPALTGPKFERRVRAMRETQAPDSSIERAREARESREVVLSPEHDTMAWLGARIPAVEAVAIHSRLRSAARSMRRCGDSRTMAQLMADVLCSVMLERKAGAPGVERSTYLAIRPRVIVTVPVMSLLGSETVPATLDGYGPIDLETARRVAADAPYLQRLLTHPHTGVELSLDRTRYRVPSDMQTWLRVRDGGCRFAGCNRPAHGAEIDHGFDFALGGHTSHNNLAFVCVGHHRLKHASGWSVRHVPGRPGDLEWTSPLGRRYRTVPGIERHPAGPALIRAAEQAQADRAKARRARGSGHARPADPP